MSFKYDLDTIRFMSLFEKITRAKLKDTFFLKEKLVFVVLPGELGRALGKNKSNLEKLERLLKKKVKIVEYSEVMPQFIINMIAPIPVQDLVQQDNIVTITGKDTRSKGLIIGARAQNLRELEKIVQRYFPDLKEIKVI
ncbi:NusA-like transcription termination signal-binding factor [Candidatus Woesearchaeota archaeon]|nr:NusA-like transcription termination signal-binding factor [Candidatus Woesearchaeota archaeon]